MTAARWRPTRAGIINIWEYDDQAFDFADGRMILRGPNGSGKSNALALLFPFLLEGNMSAASMDPFAGGRSMTSLLLGLVRDDTKAGRYRHDSRLGYVWLEFGRPGSTNGPARWCTIGCGARATARRGNARSWFFVTDRRVGVDLDLAPGGDPLTEPRLAEELGLDAVVATAEEHRVSVDRALYGLGRDRQHKLVSLIRVLRRPQLAGKLDLALLSQVLSGGLPALSAEVLNDVASSLDDLERTQHQLAELGAARATLAAFLPTYAAYLTGEALGRAGAVTAAAGALGKATRDARQAVSSVVRVGAELEANAGERRSAQTQRHRVDAERVAVIESPAYRSATALREVEEAARKADEALAGAERRRHDARARAERARAEADAERATAADLGRRADRALTLVLDGVDSLDLVWTLDQDELRIPERLGAGARRAERSRRDDVAVVRQALSRREDARRDHERAEQAASLAMQRADEGAAVADAAEAEAAARRAALAEAVTAWASTSPWLDDDQRGHLVAAVAEVAEPGSATLAEVFRCLTAGPRDELVAARTRREATLGRLTEERSSVQAERDQVAAASDPGPVAPPWRIADRSTRPGAPLWACCDFADGVAEHHRVGIEAALDAAGLLDAWVGPDGSSPTATDDGGGDGGEAALDAWLAPSSEGAGHDGPRLGEVLVALVPDGSGLTDQDVEAVLDAVGLGRVGISVDRDGRFVLGPLHGRAAKAEPEFIGATARAERRRRRLAELDVAIGDLDRSIEAEQQAIEATVGELEALDVAPGTLPLATDLSRAVDAAARARATAAAHGLAAADAQAAEAEAAGRAAAADDALTQEAGTRRLGRDAESLDAAEQGLGAFAASAAEAVAERRSALDAEERTRRAEQRADEADGERDERAREHHETERDAGAQRARVDTLRAQLGPDAEAPLAVVARCEVELRELGRRLDALADDRGRLEARKGKAEAAVQEARRNEAGAGERRREAATHLVVLRRRDLLAVVAPTAVAAGPTPTNRVGDGALEHDEPRPVRSEVEDDGGEVEDDGGEGKADEGSGDGGGDRWDTALPPEPEQFAAWLAEHVDGVAPSVEEQDRRVAALDRAQKALLDDLRHGYDPSVVHDDGITVVEVTSEAGTFSLAVLAEELDRQDAELRAYLSEGDREVFERFLLNRVSHELRQLLTDADEFVGGVNDALADAPTASGMRVELGWELGADDPSVRTAVRLLRRDTEQMGDEDRAELRTFFERVIGQQRAENPTGGYRAALEAALDYRSWHEFHPYLRVADGGRTKLTRTRFKELSGGEQAVALHLPLFAAVSAHYARADATAPRLVALDEAFAGIDEAMRGELMGLTVNFDLDLVMTGHELWGAYAEVPAVAVHDLLRRPPAEGVSVFSLRWDGHGLVDAEGDGPTMVVPPVDDGLFADG